MFDKDYFDKLIQRLDFKILEKKYQECLDIIQEQIGYFSIPKEYLNALNEYKEQILKLMNNH